MELLLCLSLQLMSHAGQPATQLQNRETALLQHFECFEPISEFVTHIIKTKQKNVFFYHYMVHIIVPKCCGLERDVCSVLLPVSNPLSLYSWETNAPQLKHPWSTVLPISKARQWRDQTGMATSLYYLRELPRPLPIGLCKFLLFSSNYPITWLMFWCTFVI